MVVNATKDALQFSVGEAKKTARAAWTPVYRALRQPRTTSSTPIFESGHDYNRAMREAMYGWMTRHLKGEGDGAPIAEPAIKTEDPESLRCYPGDTRPDDFVTLPRFAAAEGRKLLAAKTDPADAASWKREAEALRKTLVTKTLGGFPEVPKGSGPEVNRAGDGTLDVQSGTGDQPLGPRRARSRARRARAVLIDLDGIDSPASRALRGRTPARRLGRRDDRTLAPPGKHAWPSDKVGLAPDHNTAEWGLWIGRPMLGQWAFDVRRLLDALEATDEARPRETALIGVGPGGLVALSRRRPTRESRRSPRSARSPASSRTSHTRASDSASSPPGSSRTSATSPTSPRSSPAAGGDRRGRLGGRQARSTPTVSAPRTGRRPTSGTCSGPKAG